MNQKLKGLIKFIKDFSLFIKTMLSYCLKCRKNTESKNPKASRTKFKAVWIYI